MRDDLAECAHVGAVLPGRMCVLREFRRAGALGQHRVGEPLDPGPRHARCRRDLLDGLPGPDTGLDLAWAQGVLLLDLELTEPCGVPTRRRTQPFVRGQEEPFAALRVFAHDGLAVLVQPDHS